jgi:hypothetical protein
MANIVIDIASQFTGDKAFKKADKATDKLGKSVKNLAKGIGIAVSTTAILAFGKAAVKAAAEDEKAQKQLALALKNVGLGRDAAASEAYLQKLSTEFGIVDDQLRPAYQTLAVATRNTAQSQELLQLALDISASTGKDLASVTGALSKAYLGNNTALGKLGVGISKADLKAGKFDDIVNQLAKTFKGAATQSANTFAGKMDRLSVSIDNAKEIIGKGLIDSFMILTASTGIEDLQTKIETFATSAAENFKKLAGFLKRNETLLKNIAAVMTAMFVSTTIIVGIAKLITAIETISKALKALRTTALATAVAEMFALNPLGAAFMVAGMVALIGVTIKGVDALTDAYNRANDAKNAALKDPFAESGRGHLDELEKRYDNKKLETQKKITTEEQKQLTAKRLQLAIDKANLALGKGSDVFDINKIQLAAAEMNQAEQLGKVTNSAQLLQITNDLARLRVKQDIDALEAAIAAKDIKAIEAGTAKLNKDLGILGALTGQELKLRDIESILKDIVPKDLINLKNLDDAIAKLKAIATGFGTTPSASTSTYGFGDVLTSQITSASVAAAIAGRTGYDISGATDPRVTYGGQRIDSAGNYNSYNAEMAYAMSSAGRNAATGGNVNITVQAGVGDPNAIAEAVDKVLRDAVDRGTLRSLATA